MIINDTIIKAAKAAGLELDYEPHDGLVIKEQDKRYFRVFDPLYNETDNAMIRRGAEIDVQWMPASKYVAATAYLPDCQYFPVEIGYNNDKAKAQAEREAVILCAAAKWDAMQGEKA